MRQYREETPGDVSPDRSDDGGLTVDKPPYLKALVREPRMRRRGNLLCRSSAVAVGFISECTLTVICKKWEGCLLLPADI